MSKKKIPTLFALLLLITGAFLGVIFLDQDTSFLPRAAPEYLPNNIRITNVSDNGFAASWTTQEPTIGFIKLGTIADELNVTILDDRDQLSGENGSFRVHYVTVAGLDPNSTYYFKIGSQNNVLYDDDGESFSLQTAPATSLNSTPDTAYGTILTPAQTPAQNAIVYATLDNSSPLSTLVASDGNWSINLSAARTPDGTDNLDYDLNDSTLELLITDGNGQNTFVTTYTSDDQPVPDIILGQSQDLTTEVSDQTEEDTSLEPTPIPESKFTFTQLEATDPEADDTITLQTIPEDGFTTQDTQPLFEGTAPSSSTITITVESSPIYTDSVIVDDLGQWSWQPPSDLAEGQHSVTITYTDEDGILHTLNRSFVVASAEATAPSYAATPSATVAPTAIPTLNPSPTASASPTIVRTSNPSTESGVPVAGVSWPLYSLLIFGFTFIGAGTLLVKKL